MADADHKKKRAIIKRRLTTFQTYLKKFDRAKGSSLELQVRLEKATELWCEYNDVQTAIELLQEGEDPTLVNERDLFENGYFETIAYAKGLLKSVTPVASTTPDQNVSAVPVRDSKVKLPLINIQVFDGAYEHWMSFHDTFNDLIASNPNLSEVERLHYLRSSVTAAAAQVIENLELTDANYKIAWELLKERFENKPLTIHHHVQSILDLPSVGRESHVSLRKMTDDILQHLRVLKKLGEPIDSWDTLLIHIILPKVDYHSRREWECKRDTLKVPKFKELLEFLIKRCAIFETLQSSTHRDSATRTLANNYDKKVSIRKVSSHVSREIPIKSTCALCKQGHYLYVCPSFLELPVSERIREVKKLKLCLNCLRYHPDRQCHLGGCKQCNSHHNTLLHINGTTNSKNTVSSKPKLDSGIKGAANISQQPMTDTASTDIIGASSYCAIKGSTQILLSTAVISITDSHGVAHECRALLDSASQVNMITKDMCDRLRLNIFKYHQLIGGIGQSDTSISGSVNVTACSRHSAYRMKLSCLILDTITDVLPQKHIDTCKFTIPQELKLADPTYDIPGKVDLLIGISVFYDLLADGRINLGVHQPIMQNTKLGWVLGGIFTPCPAVHNRPSKPRCHVSVNPDETFDFERFWNIEEVTTGKRYTKEEQQCEDHFVRTYCRQQDGRFIAKIPLLKDPSVLGESREIAYKRLLSSERKFKKSPKMQESYVSLLSEYQRLGHMTEIPHEHRNEKRNYLPHHAVEKQSSTTTKLRVVFDASCETTSGKSLNNIQAVGPTIQEDLLSIILRFRQHRYVLNADVTKMYRQVLINEEQRNLQCILWRSKPEENVKTFVLNTVTYGISSAPFLAIRCLHQVALDHQDTHPEASKIILRDFYVDDLLTGGNDLQQLKCLKHDIIKILASAGFELRKWNSNHPLLTHDSLDDAIDIGESVKTLGLVWNTHDDTFQYTTHVSAVSPKITKRDILSTISQIFDPLGLVGPVIIRAKILLQRLWMLKLGWDDEVPNDVAHAWMRYHNALPQLRDIRIPRRVIGNCYVKLELHGFCDASEVAYGACIYTRAIDSNGTCTVTLLCAKSRVSPLKNISLPRLELCAALLLTNLYKNIADTIIDSEYEVYAWSDSTVTLAWIEGEPARWTTFVANRVTQIQQVIPPERWSHVNSQDNPADIVSRGISPTELSQTSLWWNGPNWLQDYNDIGPTYGMNPIAEEEIPETRHTLRALVIVPIDRSIFERFSSLTRMKRTIAYCLRFSYNTSHAESRKIGVLDPIEIAIALKVIIRTVQSQEFHCELVELRAKREVHSKSKLKTLLPFLDNDNLIRVGGRLRHASLEYNRKYPIVLPSKHILTRMIIRDEHHRHLHAGPQALLAAIRENYWILSGRTSIRSVLRNCVTCFRTRPIRSEQLMGDLPSVRVTQARPFANTGVDYAGPFQIKLSRNKCGKAYLCIFVCLVTKAVHLEVASDLSTSAFLRTFKRFIARRGKCTAMYSDNGANFLGAKNELKELYNVIKDKTHQTKVSEYLSDQSIKWILIPPHSPHVGGIWEAAVKSAKTHLRRVIGATVLSFEELYTIFTQIEACMNSRPLCPMSSDPRDLNVLTPGHFLIGTPLTALPEGDLSNVSLNRLSRYQLLTRIQQDFWRRWSREYVVQLQQRFKWQRTTNNNIKPGTLVLLWEDGIPPLRWRVGRIVNVYPGNDGLIRTVDVRTTNGVLQRTIQKVCVLPLSNDENESK